MCERRPRRSAPEPAFRAVGGAPDRTSPPRKAVQARLLCPRETERPAMTFRPLHPGPKLRHPPQVPTRPGDCQDVAGTRVCDTPRGLFLPRSQHRGTFSSHLRPPGCHATPSNGAPTACANGELWGSVVAPPLSSRKVLGLKGGGGGWERKLHIQSELLRGGGGANREKPCGEPTLAQPEALQGTSQAHLHPTDNDRRGRTLPHWAGMPRDRDARVPRWMTTRDLEKVIEARPKRRPLPTSGGTFRPWDRG